MVMPMKKAIGAATWAFVIVWMIGLGDTPPRPDATGALPPARLLPVNLATAATTGSQPATPPVPCPDLLAVVKAFFDANDAGRLDAGLAFLMDDATLASWAEGVNGYHMTERHLTGKAEIRGALGKPGLRRTTGRPNDPIYKETEAKVSGDTVKFILRPDRLRPSGKPYHPYQVELRFAGCKIKALTVVELITWL